MSDGALESSSLVSQFSRTLARYEAAVEDLREKQQPSTSTRKHLILLENIVTSLISWSVDIRASSNSLAAIEGTSIADELQSTLEALEHQCKALSNSRSDGNESVNTPWPRQY
jgi:hypothetical protein